MIRFWLEPPFKIVFERPDRDTTSGSRFSTVTYPDRVPPAMVNTMAQATIRVGNPRSVGSWDWSVGCLRSIFGFIDAVPHQIIPPESWDDFVYAHFYWQLNDGPGSHRTRVNQWSCNAKFYAELRRLGLLPCDVMIPPAKVRGGCPEDGISPLGRKKEFVDIPKNLKELSPKHLLAAQGLELDDDVYLLGFQSKLQTANDAILECLKDYWEKLRACHRIGSDLLSSISDNDIAKALLDPEHWKIVADLIKQSSIEGVAWFLALLNHFTFKEYKLTKFTEASIIKLPILANVLYESSTRKKLYSQLTEIAADVAPPVNDKTLPPLELIARLLGTLSGRDCAAACSMLTIWNPGYTPGSTMDAELFTRNGNSYLRYRDISNKYVFSVSKPRARSRKTSLLTDESLEIISDIIECTKKIRDRQIFLRKKNWRKLFLIATSRKIGSLARPASIMAFGSGVTLYSVYEGDLTANGVSRRDFNLSTFRSTQGILSFLEFGSLQKVASVLNNSVAVVRSRYIPIWMQLHWANRTLRILQQKLIIVSTEGSPKLQAAASDFDGQETVREFIVKKMLTDLKRGDALSQLIRERLGKYAPEHLKLTDAFVESEYMYRLDSETLGAMYAYSELREDGITFKVTSPSSKRDILDQDLSALVGLIKMTAQTGLQELSNAEHAILDKIAGDSWTLFERTHEEALRKVPYYKNLFLNKAPQVDEI